MKKRVSSRPTNALFRNNFRHLLVFLLPCMALILGFAYVRLSLDRSAILRQESAYVQEAASQMNAQLSGAAMSVRQLTAIDKVRSLSRKTSLTLTMDLIRDIGILQQQLALIPARYPCITTVLMHFSPADYFVSQVSSRQKKSEDILDLNQQQILLMEESGMVNGWHYGENGWYYFHEIKHNGKVYGSVMAHMGHSSVAAAMNGVMMDSSRRLLLMDASGRVLGDSWEQSLGEAVSSLYPNHQNNSAELAYSDGVLMSMARFPSALPGCEYLLITSQAHYNLQMRAGVWLMGAVCVLLTVLLVLLLYTIARSLSKPYEAIVTLLEKPELLTAEDYDNKYRSFDQLGMISLLIQQKNYQLMAAKSELDDKARMLREAQHAMLQAQMNPHFLFNTLDSIHWMAQENLPEDNPISGMICLLSRLLRISLQSTSPLTTVAQEIEHARLYLEIQRIRLDHPPQIVWQVDEALQGCEMLCLSLQPLLENAINHGIRRMQDGQIRISIQCRGASILATVTDNGNGLSPEQMEKLHESLATPLLFREKHIGLANIKARLLLIYGERAALRIESDAGVYTRVEMEFPAAALRANDVAPG